MSMEITNNYSDYGKGYTNTAKEGNVTTSTVELKTSTGGTKTEQIKTGYSNVNDYSKYLQGKYSYMNSGTTSMQGVPTADPAWKAGKPIKPGALDGITRESVEADLKKSGSSLARSSLDIQI